MYSFGIGILTHCRLGTPGLVRGLGVRGAGLEAELEREGGRGLQTPVNPPSLPGLRWHSPCPCLVGVLLLSMGAGGLGGSVASADRPGPGGAYVSGGVACLGGAAGP